MNQISKKTLVFTAILLFIVGSLAQIQAPNPLGKTYEWVAHPLYISPFAGSLNPQGYSPSQMKAAYNLPSSGGDGKTIAVIDAYHTPNILSYYNIFSYQYGLPDNSTGNFLVRSMTSQTDSGWALETCLDVEWAHAIAPNATILLVEAKSNSDDDLLEAVDYATSQTSVVAVSMSWGGDELFNQANLDYHFNKPGITFFASSGDDGSSVIWPAVSANVVSVGGTTLNLNADGTVISEVAWGNSSGGISSYIAKPAFQTNFGLTYANRAVPDVSYNGNALTGVSVYNGTWWKMGGTSAGAPQWAGIHALGLSATNTNLYNKAKADYSSYFRDITIGANNVYSTNIGYDLVTGLGSPLTMNFATEFTVSPSSGPPGGLISINGVGFLGNSASISYLNPLNSSWIPLTNNLAVVNGNFTYTFNAPDLRQSNPAGDNQPSSDNIFFRAQDNGNGRSYNTIVPYTEWRRGILQLGDVTANGLYGNNTNLTLSLFVQIGDILPFKGEWFSPGDMTLLWDNATSLGSFSIDNNGFFDATLKVPATTVGQHTISSNDGVSNFCLTLTRLPTVANDYIDRWHTQEFTIALIPDSPMNETLFRINDGPILDVTNGQPTISSEGNNNSLEYWSAWNLYGTGTIEIPHVKVTGIKLDETPPVGSILTNPSTNTPTITLSLMAADATSGVSQMRFSNDGSTWSSWEKFETSKLWLLEGGEGQKTVNVQFVDNANLTSSLYNYTVILTMPEPTTTPTATTIPIQNPTPSLTPATGIVATPTDSPVSPTNNEPTKQPSPATMSITVVLAVSLIAAIIVCLAVLLIRTRK